jgi:hypothetical protein
MESMSSLGTSNMTFNGPQKADNIDENNDYQVLAESIINEPYVET